MHHRRLLLGLWLAGIGWLTGCQTAPPVSVESQSQNLFWPTPPAESRLTYVRAIRQPADVGIQSSGLGRFFRRVFGTDSDKQLQKPFGIAFDEAGNLCLTDTGNNTVIFCDRQNQRWLRWDHIGRQYFQSPVAVAKTNDLLMVADPGLGQVVAFNTAGKLRWTSREELSHPVGLALANGKLYVADGHRHRIAMFDLTGKFLGAFGQRGKGPGEFNYPTHLAADAAGNLYVTDSGNARIQIFDPAGRWQGDIGSAGDAPGYFSRPKGVAASSAGQVHVVDANFDNFQIFDRSGRFLLDVGSAGAGPGEFWLPNGIAISRTDEIYVTDCYNHRVQVFRPVTPP